MSEPTPGPWKVRKRKRPDEYSFYYPFHVGNAETRETVCECLDEQTANLIAAAPELLAACEEALRLLRKFRMQGPVYSMIEEAIKKARGSE